MRAPRAVRNRLRSKVLVTLKSGEVFAGVLFEADDRAIVLRNTTVMQQGPDPAAMPVDGELLLLLADVAFVQKT